MARPSNRRSGYSRKAQLGAFTGYVVASAGALAGAVLLAISLLRPGTFEGLKSEAMDVVAPAGEGGAVVRTNGYGLVDRITGYFSAGTQNVQLKREAAQARVKLKEAEALKAENQRLKALLGLAESEVKPVAFARLIGSTSSSTRRFAYLSAGRDQGVTPRMPVRSPLGLLGRVLEVGDSSARVLLLTDSASVIPVRRSTDNVVAFAEGRADGTLRLRLINLGVNPLKKGDVFVTSGAGGIYRPGIAVARVSALTRDGAIARVLSDPAATQYVAVEPVWIPAAVEPPAPVADEPGGAAE